MLDRLLEFIREHQDKRLRVFAMNEAGGYLDQVDVAASDLAERLYGVEPPETEDEADEL